MGHARTALRRALAFLLAMTLALSLGGLPVAYGTEAGDDAGTLVAAQETDPADFTYDIRDASATFGAGAYIIDYKGASKAVVVPATFGDAPVVSIDLHYQLGLTSLDVTACSSLKYLDCSRSSLASLDVSNSPALVTLDCYGNSLSTLDVSRNAALTYLDCRNNSLASLEVGEKVALTYLWCSWNPLDSLDVSRCTALVYLHCSLNSLSSLDVGNSPALTWLYCDGNSLTSLDVSRNTELTYLDCSSNSLASLDVSKNTALKYLYCSYNSLTTLDVSGNAALLDFWCYHNSIPDSEARRALVARFGEASVLPQDDSYGTLPLTGDYVFRGIADVSEAPENAWMFKEYSDIPAGTANSAGALGLPARPSVKVYVQPVNAVGNDGLLLCETIIRWDESCPDYDPSSKTVQTFYYGGKVSLPENITVPTSGMDVLKIKMAVEAGVITYARHIFEYIENGGESVVSDNYFSWIAKKKSEQQNKFYNAAVYVGFERDMSDISAMTGGFALAALTAGNPGVDVSSYGLDLLERTLGLADKFGDKRIGSFDEFVYSQAEHGLNKSSVSALMGKHFAIKESGGALSAADAVGYIEAYYNLKLGMSSLNFGANYYSSRLSTSPWDVMGGIVSDILTGFLLSKVTPAKSIIGSFLYGEIVVDRLLDPLLESCEEIGKSADDPYYWSWYNEQMELRDEMAYWTGASGAKTHVNTLHEVHCPVDVEVYAPDGRLLGTVSNGDDLAVFDDATTWTDGESKYVSIPWYAKGYHIEMVGTGSGSMDFVVRSANATTGANSVVKSFSNVRLEAKKRIIVTQQEEQPLSDTKLYVADDKGEITASIQENGGETPLKVSILFDCNGGTLVGERERAITVNSKIGTLPTPARSGYSFDGWFTSKAGGTTVTAATVFSADATIYAHWTAAPSTQATVTFNANGGKVAGKAAASVKRAYGQTLGKLATPTRTGYSFQGWFTGKVRGTKVTANTRATKSVTYYAHWKAKTHTVKLNAVGGKVGKASAASVKRAYGQTLGRLATPKRTGYAFQGWFTGKVKGTKVTAKTRVTRNVTYWAHWAKIHTVKLNAVGGKVGGKASASVKKAHNAKLGKLATPKRAGYRFLGWYTGKAGGKKVTTNTKVTKAVTLYAHWKRAR